MNPRKAILIGDHKQLEPTVKSDFSKSNGLNVSLIEKLWDLLKEKETLEVQYRMDPKIREFPSRYFYGDILKDGDNVIQRSKNNSLRDILKINIGSVCFFNGGDNWESRKNTGYVNESEANNTVNFLFQLLSEIIQSQMSLSIGIVTPYNEQKKIIENKMKCEMKKWN